MIHKTLDDAFINSAYLSELWASIDLIRCKKAGHAWSPEREIQLQDEVRHANALLNVLKSQTGILVKDLQFSMQEKLFKDKVNLSETNSIGDVSLVHDITERRAVWIYKTYLKMATNPVYKSVITEILADEKNHFAVNKKEAHPDHTPYSKKVKKTDFLIFKEYLPSKYGQKLFSSSRFWEDYFNGAKNDYAEND